MQTFGIGWWKKQKTWRYVQRNESTSQWKGISKELQVVAGWDLGILKEFGEQEAFAIDPLRG